MPMVDEVIKMAVVNVILGQLLSEHKGLTGLIPVIDAVLGRPRKSIGGLSWAMKWDKNAKSHCMPNGTRQGALLLIV